MSEPVEPDDYVIRSVTISEVLGPDGARYITYATEGDPADWDVLGLIGYISAVIRSAATLPDVDE